MAESIKRTDPRMRRLARAALAAYDIEPLGVRLVATSFNTVYRVTTATGDLVLRVGGEVRVNPVDAAFAEDLLTRELADAGIRVPLVQRTRDGAPSVWVHDDELGERECMLLTWTPGRRISRPTSAADRDRLARLSASLHRVATPRLTRPRGALDGRSALLVELPDRLGDLPRADAQLVAAGLEIAQDAVDGIWEDSREPPLLVHGDLTPSNVLRDGGELVPIDFQDLSWSHREQDLAITLYGLTAGELDASEVAAFRAAYETVLPWPTLDEELLRRLILARRLTMVHLGLNLRRPGIEAFLERHLAAIRTLLP